MEKERNLGVLSTAEAIGDRAMRTRKAFTKGSSGLYLALIAFEVGVMGLLATTLVPVFRSLCGQHDGLTVLVLSSFWTPSWIAATLGMAALSLAVGRRDERARGRLLSATALIGWIGSALTCAGVGPLLRYLAW